jgi:hypothetical protein
LKLSMSESPYRKEDKNEKNKLVFWNSTYRIINDSI